MIEIKKLEKEIINLKQQNLKLQKEIEDYKEIIKELKSITFKIPDDEQGEASIFYDSE
jgi:predicted RNase H-like nuclease (RuvC/YqgF family)